ncbi:hypothetical protein HYV44_00510 [Candidatus Microgenomates bacterium]|nr:hypothetical protein [Candidatus Microgenomates bacterium]
MGTNTERKQKYFRAFGGILLALNIFVSAIMLLGTGSMSDGACSNILIYMLALVVVGILAFLFFLISIFKKTDKYFWILVDILSLITFLYTIVALVGGNSCDEIPTFLEALSSSSLLFWGLYFTFVPDVPDKNIKRIVVAIAVATTIIMIFGRGYIWPWYYEIFL